MGYISIYTDSEQSGSPPPTLPSVPASWTFFSMLWYPYVTYVYGHKLRLGLGKLYRARPLSYVCSGNEGMEKNCAEATVRFDWSPFFHALLARGNFFCKSSITP